MRVSILCIAMPKHVSATQVLCCISGVYAKCVNAVSATCCAFAKSVHRERRTVQAQPGMMCVQSKLGVVSF